MGEENIDEICDLINKDDKIINLKLKLKELNILLTIGTLENLKFYETEMKIILLDKNVNNKIIEETITSDLLKTLTLCELINYIIEKINKFYKII